MVRKKPNKLSVSGTVGIMKFNYRINKQSYVVVDDSNGYKGQLFKNGCSRGLMSKETETLDEMETWIEELKEVFKDD